MGNNGYDIEQRQAEIDRIRRETAMLSDMRNRTQLSDSYCKVLRPDDLARARARVDKILYENRFW